MSDSPNATDKHTKSDKAFNREIDFISDADTFDMDVETWYFRPTDAVKAAVKAPSPPSDSPQMVPVLDKDKGKRAADAYSKFIKLFCKSLEGSEAGRSQKLKKVGFDEDADINTLCLPDRFVKPIASGALMTSGADEVLLETSSGLGAFYDMSTLALMRDTGAGYRLVFHMLRSGGFDAYAHIAHPSGRDILFICARSGNMGLYPSICGFPGLGSFRAGSEESDVGPGGKNELELVDYLVCGPGASVTLGKIILRDRRLLVELLVEEYLLEFDGSSNSIDGCGKKTIRSKNSFTIEYELESAGIRQLTPIPRQVRAVLMRY